MPTGQEVVVNFNEFDTEALYDTVKVCNGPECFQDSVIAELSGQLSATGLRYQSDDSVLTIELVTDGRIVGRGFRASFSSVAGSSTRK